MKKAIFTIAALAIMCSVNAKKLTLTQLAKAPTIDAKETDWTSTWNAMDQSKGTTSTLTGKMQVGYDQKALYLIFDITDASADTSSTNSYENDCIEVCLSLDTNGYSRKGKYVSGSMQLRKQRDKDFPRGIDGGQGHGSSKDTANIGGEVWDVTGFKNHGNVVEDDQGTKYIQEWEIDWQPIVDSTRLYGGTWKWDGGSLNLDVQAADNTGLPAGATTGGRTQQSFWNSNADVQWDDTRAEGLVILSTKVDVRGIAPMVNSVSMNTLVTNDVLTFSTTVKSLSIYDLTGKAVVDNLQNVSSVNIGYLSSGIYLVRIDNMTHKIVKR